jgi:hypothetical protein
MAAFYGADAAKTSTLMTRVLSNQVARALPGPRALPLLLLLLLLLPLLLTTTTIIASRAPRDP